MESFQPGAAASRPVSRLELSISCNNLLDKDMLSKSDPFVVVIQVHPNGNNSELGRTETIQDNLNPVFEKKIMVDYFFEERQVLEFHAYDSDSDSRDLSHHDFLGAAAMALGEIVSSPEGRLQRPAMIGGRPQGSIGVLAEEVSTNNDAVDFQIRANKLDKMDWFGKSDPYINIYRANEASGNPWTLVKRTEVIKNTLDPSWKPFNISADALCRGDYDRSLRFEVVDWNSDGSADYIGEFVTSLREISGFESQQPAVTVHDVVNARKKEKKGSKYKNSGTVSFLKASVRKRFSFLEYIHGGMDLNFTVAVDFTASNGNPNDPRSLHHRNPSFPNQYQQAIRAVGDIIQDYDADKLFPALGFGAKLPPDGRVSHNFHLNFHPSNPHCERIDGVLLAYQNAISQIQLYGPTNFSPVIQEFAQIASTDRSGANYYVLLIITDGIITDMPNTIREIVAASYLPMSIIIVGVGDADFEAMDALDADDALLSYGQTKAQRDIVQFVPFRNFNQGRDFAGNQARLAKAVLEELPSQVTLYMELNGIKPGPGRRAPPPSAAQAPPMPPMGDTPPPSYQEASFPPQHGGAPPNYGGPPPQHGGAPHYGGAPHHAGAPSGGAPPPYAPQYGAPYPPQATNPFYPTAP